MEQGEERPEESFDEERGEAHDWYFDLPSGAWERQEQKNRELRQNLLRGAGQAQNSETAPGGTAPKGRLFGRNRRRDDGPGQPELERRSSDDEQVARFRSLEAMEAAGAADGWSTEPVPGSEAAGGRASSRWDELFGPSTEDPQAGSDHGRMEAAPAGQAQGSRWAELFGEAAAAEDPADAMRAWANGSVAETAGERAPEAESPAAIDSAAQGPEARVEATTPEELRGEHRLPWEPETARPAPEAGCLNTPFHAPLRSIMRCWRLPLPRVRLARRRPSCASPR